MTTFSLESVSTRTKLHPRCPIPTRSWTDRKLPVICFWALISAGRALGRSYLVIGSACIVLDTGSTGEVGSEPAHKMARLLMYVCVAVVGVIPEIHPHPPERNNCRFSMHQHQDGNSIGLAKSYFRGLGRFLVVSLEAAW